MAKYLVIVESPAKVKTIKNFLGANYEVMASNGHVRDFPKSQLGFDVEHNYEPKYITIRGKGDILAKLRKEAKKADKVYLATDRNAHTIKDDKIIQIFVNKEILYQGRIQEKINNNLINIYDRERLLVEIIRKKKQIPYDYYKEIIRNHRDISYELDMYKIEEYLSLYKNNLNLALTLKNEVF